MSSSAIQFRGCFARPTASDPSEMSSFTSPEFSRSLFISSKSPESCVFRNRSGTSSRNCDSFSDALIRLPVRTKSPVIARMSASR